MPGPDLVKPIEPEIGAEIVSEPDASNCCTIRSEPLPEVRVPLPAIVAPPAPALPE